jgi:hypothetical protein
MTPNCIFNYNYGQYLNLMKVECPGYEEFALGYIAYVRNPGIRAEFLEFSEQWYQLDTSEQLLVEQNAKFGSVHTGSSKVDSCVQAENLLFSLISNDEERYLAALTVKYNQASRIHFFACSSWEENEYKKGFPGQNLMSGDLLSADTLDKLMGLNWWSHRNDRWRAATFKYDLTEADHYIVKAMNYYKDIEDLIDLMVKYDSGNRKVNFRSHVLFFNLTGDVVKELRGLIFLWTLVRGYYYYGADDHVRSILFDCLDIENAGVHKKSENKAIYNSLNVFIPDTSWDNKESTGWGSPVSWMGAGGYASVRQVNNVMSRKYSLWYYRHTGKLVLKKNFYFREDLDEAQALVPTAQMGGKKWSYEDDNGHAYIKEPLELREVV